jgi:hypothetical protein
MSYSQREPQGTGWLLFSSIVLITAGIMRVFDAFWAFDKDDEVSELTKVLIFDDNLAAYGWLWLIVGVLLIAAGFAVGTGSEWARWFGIVMAAFGSITSFLWIYQYPLWSLLATLICLLVIYGLASSGGLSTRRRPPARRPGDGGAWTSRRYAPRIEGLPRRGEGRGGPRWARWATRTPGAGSASRR